MNSEQLASLLRQALLVGGGWLVNKGYIDQDTLVQIVGGVVIVATAIYGLYVRRKAGLINSAARQPEVAKIETTPALAKATASKKVVSK